MPIYEYQCKTCKQEFECVQKISEPPLTRCPKCGKKVRRIISQTTFKLKGGGWYKDGYASGTPKKSEAKSQKQEIGDKKQEGGSKKQETGNKK